MQAITGIHAFLDFNGPSSYSMFVERSIDGSSENANAFDSFSNFE
jgi:hypothetical protein